MSTDGKYTYFALDFEPRLIDNLYKKRIKALLEKIGS